MGECVNGSQGKNGWGDKQSNGNAHVHFRAAGNAESGERRLQVNSIFIIYKYL
jgi:hypothetical protein